MMKRLAACTLALVASTVHLPAMSAAVGLKCTAQYTDTTWPYYSTQLYTPDNIKFKFICPNLPPQTIPELYNMNLRLVGLPWIEKKFGGQNHWVIWIESY